MRPEPDPNRKTCYVCKKTLDRSVQTYGEKDAFCSATCCREYYGTEVPLPVRGIAVGASS